MDPAPAPLLTGVALPLLSEIPRPFIVGVVVEHAAEEVVPAVARAAAAGCQAAEVNLTALGAAGSVPWTPEELSDLAIPVYTSARRRAFMAAYGLPWQSLPELDDETRMRWQLELLGRGSVALDLELDAFASVPVPAPGTTAAAALGTERGPACELTHDPEAVERQRSVIAEAHERGGEVIASCHTGTRQGVDDLVTIVMTAADRRADLVKVVAPCPEVEDLVALLSATARLCELGRIPFTLVGVGACGALSRYVGPHLGSGWTFASIPDGSWSFAEQPTATDLRQVLAAISWRYSEVRR